MEELFVDLTAIGQRGEIVFKKIIDHAARWIWMDQSLNTSRCGKLLLDSDGARYVGWRPVSATGRRKLSFKIWGADFKEYFVRILHLLFTE